MDLVVYDDDEQRYVPWVVALAAVLLVALLTAVLTFVLVRQASGDEAEQPLSGVSAKEPATEPTATTPPTTAPVVGPTPAPACVSALLVADNAIERSIAIDDALAQHTAIMDELLAERIDAQQALDQTLPVLTAGATERSRFQEAVARYREAREQCAS